MQFHFRPTVHSNMHHVFTQNMLDCYQKIPFLRNYMLEMMSQLHALFSLKISCKKQFSFLLVFLMIVPFIVEFFITCCLAPCAGVGTSYWKSHAYVWRRWFFLLLCHLWTLFENQVNAWYLILNTVPHSSATFCYNSWGPL